MDAVVIVTTTPSREDAERIARAAVEQKCAACAQISGPIISIYRWQGEIETATEWRLWLKTRQELYRQVEQVILSLHPYNTPQILALPCVAGLAAYVEWLERETSGS